MATAENPFPAGSSPFRAKGVVYLGAFAYFERHIPGGRDAVLARLTEPDLVAFFRQPILAASWYDVFPSLLMHRAAAAVAGQPLSELIRVASREQAQRDVNGIYRVLLRLASPEQVIARTPRVAAQYFDFIRAELHQRGPRHYETVATGLPAVVAPTYMPVTEGFLETTLELAGAKRVRQRWSAPEPDGTRAGVELVKVRREISWE